MSSNVPWRKAGVKYTQNEIYFDIIEEIDATVAAYENKPKVYKNNN